MEAALNTKFSLGMVIARSRMVEIKKLYENLMDARSDYISIDPDGAVHELDHIKKKDSFSPDAIMYKCLNLIDEKVKEGFEYLAGYRLSGLSVIERELSSLDWRDRTYLTFNKIVISKTHALRILEDVLNKKPYNKVPEWSLVLYILINSVEVAFISDKRLSENSKQSEFSSDNSLSALDESLFILDCAAKMLNSCSEYFKKIFSRWLTQYYFYCLTLVLKDGGASSSNMPAQSNLVSKFRAHYSLYSLILKVGRKELCVDERMALNTIECNSNNMNLVNKARTERSLKRHTILERPISHRLHNCQGSRKLVSVITVVRNLYASERIAHFELMLNSVLSQTYDIENIEHVVIDGASNDGTLEYLQKIWSSKRVDKVVSEPDTGVYDAMNKGISYSNGEYFIFMNSDDYFSSSAIEKLVAAIEHKDASYAYSDAWQIDDRNYKVGTVLGEIDSAWFKVPYCHQTLLCRSSDLKNYRFDESYKITMMAYASGLVLKGLKSAYVPEKLAYYRIGNGLSSSPENKAAYQSEVRTAKLEVCNALGLAEGTYHNIDNAWRKVKTQAQFEEYNKLLQAEKIKYERTDLLNRFFDSVESYGRYRVRLFSGETRRAQEKIRKPKVALITTHTYGGAGGAVHRLHLRLRSNEGIDNVLVTRNIEKSRSIPDIQLISMPDGDWPKNQNQVSVNPNSTIFTVSESSLTEKYIEMLIDEYDVFSLQWTARLLSAENIGKLISSGKPVVITVRDMEPISGGCHYFHGCENWRTNNCFDCPQIIRGDKNIAAKTFKTKLNQWRNGSLTFVALSDISKNLILQSPIAKGCRVEKISNGFDPDAFSILDKNESRFSLGLPEEFRDAYLIGLIPSFSSTVKGFDLAVKVLNHAMKASSALNKKVKILLAGAGGASFSERLCMPSHTLGVIDNGPSLNLFYSACDLLMVPSREETFSNTVAESLLSGTPVFGANAGAIPEMILENINGSCFSHDWSIAEIAESLSSCIDNKYQPIDCRRMIVECFSIDKQADHYSVLFNELYGSAH